MKKETKKSTGKNSEPDKDLDKPAETTPDVSYTVLRVPENISAISGLRPTENAITACDLSVKDESADDVYPVAQAFWQMTLSTLNDLPKDKTLYIFLGESHACPSHKMTQAAILSLASAWRDTAKPEENRNFVFAKELPFNELAEVASCYDLDVPRSIKFTLPDEDPKGKIIARALSAKTIFSLAPLTSAHLYSHVLDKDIPLALTDSAMLPSVNIKVLDATDPILSESAKFLSRNVSELTFTLKATNRTGIAWRNASMVLRGEKAAEKFKARIVFQQGGRSHLLGDKRARYPFEESWLALQNKRGNAAIGLLPAESAQALADMLPEKKPAELGQSVAIVRGLEYEYHDEINPKKERVYLGNLRQAFSGPAGYLPPVLDAPYPSRIKPQIEAAIRRAIDKGPPSFPPPMQNVPGR